MGEWLRTGYIVCKPSNGLCSISLAIPELEIQSSKVELSNGLCSISLDIPKLEIQSSKAIYTHVAISLTVLKGAAED